MDLQIAFTVSYSFVLYLEILYAICTYQRHLCTVLNYFRIFLYSLFQTNHKTNVHEFLSSITLNISFHWLQKMVNKFQHYLWENKCNITMQMSSQPHTNSAVR